MARCQRQIKPKTVAEKLRLHLSECDKDFDVTFLVGSQNVKVMAVRLILVASSPVFKQLFKEKWDQAVSKEVHAEGIPLPDVDPETFCIFLQLLLCDDVSATKLNTLDLTVKDRFNLLELCKNYGMMELCANLETLLKIFFSKLPEFVGTDEFLGLPRNTLKQILQHEFQAPDEITMFENVIKWAEFQCDQQNIEKNGANIRDVLGDCLTLIRFPIMDIHDFGNRVCPTNILTAQEKLKLFEFIVLPEDKRNSFDASSLGFNTSSRCPKEAPLCSTNHTVPDVMGAKAQEQLPDPCFLRVDFISPIVHTRKRKSTCRSSRSAAYHVKGTSESQRPSDFQFPKHHRVNFADRKKTEDAPVPHPRHSTPEPEEGNSLLIESPDSEVGFPVFRDYLDENELDRIDGFQMPAGLNDTFKFLFRTTKRK